MFDTHGVVPLSVNNHVDRLTEASLDNIVCRGPLAVPSSNGRHNKVRVSMRCSVVRYSDVERQVTTSTVSAAIK